ncbi:MAG: hypothetical protein ACFCU2_09550 [Acidimicrobiia bacterium]
MRPKRVQVGLVAGLLLSLALPSLAQTQQTLAISPDTGPPGTEVSLFGEGYPDDPQDITVAWGDSGQTMDAEVRIENGILTGTAVVPEDALADAYVVEACAFDPGSDDVFGPDDFFCGITQFIVTPSIIVSPEAGTPGAPLELSGAGFPQLNVREWDVRWDADNTFIGTALVEPDGTMAATAAVPPHAAQGPGSISVCSPPSSGGEVVPACYPASPPIEVYYPDVTADPGELLAGTPFEVRGEEWCCTGERGDIIDTRSGDVWGEAVVDDNRLLTGTGIVPEASEPGEHIIEVCVLDLCRPTAIQVTAPPPPTTVPPGVCGVVDGSMRVEPSAGDPGSPIEVIFVGSEGSPEGCRVVLRLNGEEISDVFELGPGATLQTRANIPQDVSAGDVVLTAIDADDGRELASTFFLVAGLTPAEPPFPWIWVGLGVLALSGLIAALTRPNPVPPPDPAPVIPPEAAPLKGGQPAKIAPPLVPIRWLEARLYAVDGAGEVGVPYFRSGATHRIEVTVGAQDIPGEVAPYTMRLVLSEPNLLTAPQTAEVMISRDGPSTAASLTLRVPHGTASVDSRLVLLSGNHVVHTARLPATVGQPPPGPARNVASIETVVRAASVPPIGAGVSAAVVVEQGRFPILTAISATGPARLIRLPESGAEAIETIRHRLAEIVDAPDDFAGLEQESTRRLLVFLANHGRLLRNAVVKDFLGEELAASSSLQLVSAEPDAYLPLELAYEFLPPHVDAAICPRASDTLRAIDLLAPCPGSHYESVVCPIGFWGISKVIERHAYQSRDDLPSGFLAQAQPIAGRDRIALNGLLLGASHRIDAYNPNTSDRLRHQLSEAGEAKFVDTWTAWDAAVAAAKPSLLVLLPHTVYSDELALPGLEIGESDRRWVSAFGEARMTPGTPTIVLLLGCETAVAGAVSYERFPGNLRKAGASIVVATLTDVLGRQAAPLAERLVDLLIDSAAGPTRLGEAVTRLRRQLLSEGMPMVLALAVFGDADWLVGGG